MKKISARILSASTILFALLVLGVLATPRNAEANLCKVPRNGIPSIYPAEENAMTGDVFDPATEGNWRGSPAYNARVLMCNRKRDTKGRKIEKYRSEHGARPGTVFGFDAELPFKRVRGRIKYFGFAPLEYGYLLGRQNGVWQVWVPIQLHFPKLKFPNKLDIPIELADRLNIRNQCEQIIRPDNRPADEWACRLPRRMMVNGTPITQYLTVYWKNSIEQYWSGRRFAVIILTNLNDPAIPRSIRKYFRKFTWQIRMNHNKNSRAMYHAAPYRPAPIYTGLPREVIAHEFGHFLGLDDEYPEKSPSKAKPSQVCWNIGGISYMMCVSGNYTPAHTKAVYRWIITRRYSIGE